MLVQATLVVKTTPIDERLEHKGSAFDLLDLHLGEVNFLQFLTPQYFETDPFVLCV